MHDAILEILDGLETADQVFNIILSEAIPRLFSIVKTRQEARLDNTEQRIITAVERRMTSEHHRLEMLEEKVSSRSPLAEAFGST